MRQRFRWLRYFLMAVFSLYLLLVLINLTPIHDSDLPTIFQTVLALPYYLVYLLHQAGMPGLLANDGLCGWGWCAPTLFGWLVILLPLLSLWLMICVRLK